MAMPASREAAPPQGRVWGGFVGGCGAGGGVRGAVGAEANTCAERGPPRAEPGLPLIYNYKYVPAGVSAKSRSRRPAVGHAQTQLNAFLRLFDEARARGDLPAFCRGNAAQVAALRAKLPAQLTLDCVFGDQTELATKFFQTCQRLKKLDGRIGPETWARLNTVPNPPSPSQIVSSGARFGAPLIGLTPNQVGHDALRLGFNGILRLTLEQDASGIVVGHGSIAGSQAVRVVDEPTAVDPSKPILASFFTRRGSPSAARGTVLIVNRIHPDEDSGQAVGQLLLDGLPTSKLLAANHVVFLHNANPDSATRRFNIRGVDVNRNFFGEPGDRGAGLSSKGVARQLEAQVIMDVIGATCPRLIIALHSVTSILDEGVFLDVPKVQNQLCAARAMDRDEALTTACRIANGALAQLAVANGNQRLAGNRQRLRKPQCADPKPVEPLSCTASPITNLVFSQQPCIRESLGGWATGLGIPVITIEPLRFSKNKTGTVTRLVVAALARSILASV